MLRQPTGRHLLDSGDAYGRHWERNQTRDFEAEEPVAIEVWGNEIMPSIRLYHYLRERLEYDPRMDRLFHRWAKRQPDHKYWLQLMEEFTHGYLRDLALDRGVQYELLGTGNSYNGECLLDQTIQYSLFQFDSEDYVLLQIHNGCDVRGGYTTPRVFRCPEEAYSLLDYSRCLLVCEPKRTDAPGQLLLLPPDQKGQPVPDPEPHVFSYSLGDYCVEDLYTAERVDLRDLTLAPVDAEGEWGIERWPVTEDGQLLCPRCGGPIHGAIG